MKTTLLLCALLVLSGCADQYGHVDPVRTGLMGAAVGGGLGLVGGAIARDQLSGAAAMASLRATAQPRATTRPPPGYGRY
jgi:hypothetical protein